MRNKRMLEINNDFRKLGLKTKKDRVFFKKMAECHKELREYKIIISNNTNE